MAALASAFQVLSTFAISIRTDWRAGERMKLGTRSAVSLHAQPPLAPCRFLTESQALTQSQRRICRKLHCSLAESSLATPHAERVRGAAPTSPDA